MKEKTKTLREVKQLKRRSVFSSMDIAPRAPG